MQNWETGGRWTRECLQCCVCANAQWADAYDSLVRLEAPDEAGTWMNSCPTPICNVCYHNMLSPLPSEPLRYIISTDFPAWAVGTWASKQLDFITGWSSWVWWLAFKSIELIWIFWNSQAAWLCRRMKFMGLATTAYIFIIMTFLLPSPATAAPTLYIFSRLKDTLTNIGGFVLKIHKLLIWKKLLSQVAIMEQKCHLLRSHPSHLSRALECAD